MEINMPAFFSRTKPARLGASQDKTVKQWKCIS